MMLSHRTGRAVAISLLKRSRSSSLSNSCSRGATTALTSTASSSSSRQQIRWLATKRQQRMAAAAAANNTASSQKKKDTSSSSEKPTESSPSNSSSSSTFIRTDMTEFVDWNKTHHPVLDPLQPPPDRADESGVVKRDLTTEMMDLTDIYDKRTHFSPEFSDDYESSTPLTEDMIQLLAVTNRPMTCADYMRQALTHPTYGYYTNPTTSNKVENENDDWDDDDDWDQDDPPTAGDAHAIIGPRGDFVTAPEVSQVFGECLAVWYVTQWEALGKPQAIRFIEVGPGKGTLLCDILRASLDSFSYFGSTIHQVHLVEKSRAMRNEQKQRLSDMIQSANFVFHDTDNDDITEERAGGDHDKKENKDGSVQKNDNDAEEKPTIHVTWHDTFLDVVASTKKEKEKMASFVVCQEFMDALPVHVFEKTSDGWRERLVDVNVLPDDSNNEKHTYSAAKENLSFEPHKKPRLRFVVSPDTTPALRTLLNFKKDDYSEGQVVEVCPDAILLAQDVAKFIQEQGGGAALIVDYGQEGTGDTLRGFHNHKQVHVLSRPGMVDVTADVDFGALKHAVNNNLSKKENAPFAFGPVPQGQFLGRMGIVERVSQLIDLERTTDKQAHDLYMALERLVLPEQMGERYKVMAITQKKQGIYPPDGFDNAA